VQGARRRLPKGYRQEPSVKIVARQNADWLREKAIPVSQAMFQANPNVDVVFAHNDPMAEAAIISAGTAGKDLKSLQVIGSTRSPPRTAASSP